MNINSYPFDRRSFIVAGAGSALGAMGLGLVSDASAASPNNADPAPGYPQLYRYYKALRGGFVDREVFHGVSGVFYAETNNDVIPLFGFAGLRLGRAKVEADRISMRGKESLVFFDLASGKPLDSWHNPWTGETVEVRHWFNAGGGSTRLGIEQAEHFVIDPFASHGYRADAKRSPFDGALGGTMPATGPVPFALPWRRVGPYYLLARHFNFRSPNPVTPDKWPHASTGTSIAQQEWLQFYLPADALDDPNNQDLPMLSSLTRRSPWLPFMRMGKSGIAGGMLSTSHSYKITGTIEDVPPELLAYLERHQPTQLQPYDGWGPSGSPEDFWQDYARSVSSE